MMDYFSMIGIFFQLAGFILLLTRVSKWLSFKLDSAHNDMINEREKNFFQTKKKLQQQNPSLREEDLNKLTIKEFF